MSSNFTVWLHFKDLVTWLIIYKEIRGGKKADYQSQAGIAFLTPADKIGYQYIQNLLLSYS